MLIKVSAGDFKRMFRRMFFLVPKFSDPVHQRSYVLPFVSLLLKYK